jgi:hypothetical protein
MPGRRWPLIINNTKSELCATIINPSLLTTRSVKKATVAT